MSSNKECNEFYFFHSRSFHAWLLGEKKKTKLNNLQKEYHLCNTVGLQVWVSYQQHQQNLRNLLEMQNLRSSPQGKHFRNKVRSSATCAVTSPPGDAKALLRKSLIPVRKVSLTVAPMHSKLYTRSLFPCALSCLPFLGGPTMIPIWITTHSLLHTLLKSLCIKHPCFIVTKGSAWNPCWASLFSLGNSDLSEGIGHKRAGMASPQQLTLKNMSTHFCLLAPEGCQDPVLSKFQ